MLKTIETDDLGVVHGGVERVASAGGNPNQGLTAAIQPLLSMIMNFVSSKKKSDGGLAEALPMMLMAKNGGGPAAAMQMAAASSSAASQPQSSPSSTQTA
jgi:hypothetical protein